MNVDDYVQRLGGDGARALGYQSRPRPQRMTGFDLSERDDRVDPEKPFLRGYGPVEASTCTGLELTPQAIWDVNGYYRRLGFRWPYLGITRADLREAYHRVDGESSVETTYALKQLLNPAVRHDYDRMPLGEQFFDEFVDAMIKYRAKWTAASRTATTGTTVTASEVLDEWDLKLISEDEGAQKAAPEAKAPKVSDPTAKVPWHWAYYLWRSSTNDPDRLARWQQLLISEYAKNGVQTKVSVGYFGKQPHSWVSARVGERTVLFLNEAAEPTAQMAAQAVAYVAESQITT